MAHPSEIRDLLWHVELLRAFQTQKDRVSELEEKMDELQQEASQLQQQIDYLSRCQWPREMALWPPERHIFSRKMAEEVRLINLRKPIAAGGGSGAAQNDKSIRAGSGEKEDGINPDAKIENINLKGDEGKWDFDKLVSKWRAHVREDRQRRTPNIQPAGGFNPASNVPGGVGNGSASGNTNTVGPGPGAMPWIEEKGARTSTPLQWAGTSARRSGEESTNGVSGNGNGSRSPVDATGAEDKRRTRSRGNWKNISIISDFGGD